MEFKIILLFSKLFIKISSINISEDFDIVFLNWYKIFFSTNFNSIFKNKNLFIFLICKNFFIIDFFSLFKFSFKSDIRDFLYLNYFCFGRVYFLKNHSSI